MCANTAKWINHRPYHVLYTTSSDCDSRLSSFPEEPKIFILLTWEVTDWLSSSCHLCTSQCRETCVVKHVSEDISHDLECTLMPTGRTNIELNSRGGSSTSVKGFRVWKLKTKWCNLLLGREKGCAWPLWPHPGSATVRHQTMYTIVWTAIYDTSSPLSFASSLNRLVIVENHMRGCWHSKRHIIPKCYTRRGYYACLVGLFIKSWLL